MLVAISKLKLFVIAIMKIRFKQTVVLEGNTLDVKQIYKMLKKRPRSQCTDILHEFDTNPGRSRIINGHVPVKLKV